MLKAAIEKLIEAQDLTHEECETVIEEMIQKQNEKLNLPM